MSLPFRCSIRAYRGLRRLPKSLVPLNRVDTLHKVTGSAMWRPSLNGRASEEGPEINLAQNKPNENDYVRIKPWDPMHIAFLRDSCNCTKCVDPSSGQKNFQTTDIPKDIKTASLDISPTNETVEVTWENDIPGFDSDHKSIYTSNFFYDHANAHNLMAKRFEGGRVELWNRKTISQELEFVDYDEYTNTDEGLYRALLQLQKYGLLLIRGVPESEKSVETIALRIGSLRDSLYGRTWDVKSVPEAKNVAYTSQFLGLHMDLLYMSNPPGFQFLHCLHNSCEGGSSLFSDAFWAVRRLSTRSFFALAKMNLAYHYQKGGEHYHFRHPVIEVPSRTLAPGGRRRSDINFVNYSPPFQANHIHVGPGQQDRFPLLLESLREFSSLVEDEENLFEYRLKEGECVIFNNRRVLHGRRQFDTAAGTRWLKGAYIDTDVFMSKYRVLMEKFGGKEIGEGKLVGEASEE